MTCKIEPERHLLTGFIVSHKMKYVKHVNPIFDTMGCECVFQASALFLIFVGGPTWAAAPKLLTIREEMDTSRLAPCKAAKIGTRILIPQF